MLKYENVKIGSLIRAFDFPTTDSSYIDGVVVEHSTSSCGAKVLVIKVDYDTNVERDYKYSRIGMIGSVPMETSMEDMYNKRDRVIVLDEEVDYLEKLKSEAA